MADERPEQARPEEESKKDTVRINLPPGLTGRSTTQINAPGAPPPAKPKPAVPLEDEAKQETAVMGKPATPKPKSDTSRVQVPAAKPAAPETPRPTVKLRREPEPAGTITAGPAPVAARAAAAAPSGGDAGLAIAAMVLSVVVAIYLFVQSMS